MSGVFEERNLSEDFFVFIGKFILIFKETNLILIEKKSVSFKFYSYSRNNIEFFWCAKWNLFEENS